MAKRKKKTLHYELTGETKLNLVGVQLYRIRATWDIPAHDVKKGDVGGWVSSTHVSSGKPRIGKNAWVEGEAEVYEDARVTGKAAVMGEAQVFGKARVTGTAGVWGKSQISGNACIAGHARCADVIVSGHAVISGRASVSAARVSGHAHIGGTSFVDAAKISQHAQILGNCYVFEESSVSGHAVVYDSHLEDGVTVSGRSFVEFSSVHNYSTITGDAHIFNQNMSALLSAVLADDAVIEDINDVMVLGPFGELADSVTVFRTAFGKAGVATAKKSQLEKILRDPASAKLIEAAQRRVEHKGGGVAFSANTVLS